jgi:hypothetical protein
MAFRPLIAGLICNLIAVAAPCTARAAASYPDSEAGKHAGEEATITGKVVAVSKSGKGTIYLNFGDRFPRQVFSGVVLARDQEKVGDVQAYEGKTVAITGRIELWEEKPQIVIRTPDQIKLAEPGAVPPPTAAPMPAPAPPAPSPPAPTAAVPVPPPSPTPPPPAPAGRVIALAQSWNTAPQTGDMTRKDLALLFGGQGSTGSSATPPASIIVYPEIPYLTPLSVARKRLNLESSTPSRTKITTPGMPSASLSANTFPGIFPGGFTSLSLITDDADQVVSVLVVDDNPRQRTPDVTDTAGYHTYNFIHQRVKAAGALVIKHQIATTGAPPGVVIVDSLLIDPNAPEATPPTRSTTRPSSRTTTRQPRTGKVLERSRWFVPVPLVDLILRSVGNR